MKVRFYGGPLHGDYRHVKNYQRIEVRNPTMLSLHSVQCDPQTPLFDTSTYYINTYCDSAITNEGSRVFKRLAAAIWENGELTRRDDFDMRLDMDKEPWQWSEEPSILSEPDKWWEMKLYQACDINPVRWK